MNEHHKQYHEYPYRFVVLTTYVLAAMAASIPLNTFSGINSVIQITLNTLMFPIAHTLFAYPCNYILNHYGMRPSLILASVMVVAGIWLRTFILPSQPYICLTGSLIGAIGTIFVLNTPSKVALNWFRNQKIPIVTFACILSSALSTSIGLFLPGIMINSESTTEDIVSFIRLQAIIITVPMSLLIIFFRQKPPTPPNKASNIIENKNYTQLMKNLCKNKQYVKAALAMALNYGISMAFFSNLDQLLVGLSYDQPGSIISITVLGGTIFGVVGNYLYSVGIRKTKKYKLAVTTVTFGYFSGFLLLILGYIYHAQKTVSVGLLSILFGFNFFSLPSVYILFAGQLAFPIDQTSIAGYMMAVSQTVGFGLGLGTAACLNKTRNNSIIILAIFGLLIFLSVIVAYLIKQDLRRTSFQNNQKLKLSQSESKSISLITQNQ